MSQCGCGGHQKDNSVQQVVAIKDMSVGNDTVGDMWKETKIFNDTDTLASVMKWVGKKKNVVLSLPESE